MSATLSLCIAVSHACFHKTKPCPGCQTSLSSECKRWAVRAATQTCLRPGPTLSRRGASLGGPGRHKHDSSESEKTSEFQLPVRNAIRSVSLPPPIVLLFQATTCSTVLSILLILGSIWASEQTAHREPMTFFPSLFFCPPANRLLTRLPLTLPRATSSWAGPRAALVSARAARGRAERNLPGGLSSAWGLGVWPRRPSRTHTPPNHESVLFTPVGSSRARSVGPWCRDPGSWLADH